MINWDSIIAQLSSGVDITADKDKWNLETPGYIEIYKLWENANFNMSSIKWTNFYPGAGYSEEVDQKMCAHLGITKLRAWISRIDPGYCAPWHWDVDDNEEEYLTHGPLQRYSCFISKPAPGHSFQLGTHCYSNQEQGTLIKWGNYKEWHAGSNVGLQPKFMYHLIGYKH